MLKRKQPLALPKSSHSNSYYFTMNDRAAGGYYGGYNPGYYGGYYRRY